MLLNCGVPFVIASQCYVPYCSVSYITTCASIEWLNVADHSPIELDILALRAIFNSSQFYRTQALLNVPMIIIHPIYYCNKDFALKCAHVYNKDIFNMPRGCNRMVGACMCACVSRMKVLCNFVLILYVYGVYSMPSVMTTGSWLSNTSVWQEQLYASRRHHPTSAQ